jgi:hypothetical protein
MLSTYNLQNFFYDKKNILDDLPLITVDISDDTNITNEFTSATSDINILNNSETNIIDPSIEEYKKNPLTSSKFQKYKTAYTLTNSPFYLIKAELVLDTAPQILQIPQTLVTKTLVAKKLNEKPKYIQQRVPLRCLSIKEKPITYYWQSIETAVNDYLSRQLFLAKINIQLASIAIIKNIRIPENVPTFIKTDYEKNFIDVVYLMIENIKKNTDGNLIVNYLDEKFYVDTLKSFYHWCKDFSSLYIYLSENDKLFMCYILFMAIISEVIMVNKLIVSANIDIIEYHFNILLNKYYATQFNYRDKFGNLVVRE